MLTMDRSMEILCSIPPEPGYVTIEDLAGDIMGAITREARDEVRRELSDLAQAYGGIKLSPAKVSIRRAHWSAVFAAAEEYWLHVHALDTP